jgi:hypothetical protein
MLCLYPEAVKHGCSSASVELILILFGLAGSVVDACHCAANVVTGRVVSILWFLLYWDV